MLLQAALPCSRRRACNSNIDAALQPVLQPLLQPALPFLSVGAAECICSSRVADARTKRTVAQLRAQLQNVHFTSTQTLQCLPLLFFLHSNLCKPIHYTRTCPPLPCPRNLPVAIGRIEPADAMFKHVYPPWHKTAQRCLFVIAAILCITLPVVYGKHKGISSRTLGAVLGVFFALWLVFSVSSKPSRSYSCVDPA